MSSTDIVSTFTAQGVLFESHPESNTCYMKDIPAGVLSMERFAAFLDKKTVSCVSILMEW